MDNSVLFRGVEAEVIASTKIPNQQFACDHVKAGFMVYARLIRDKYDLVVCYECYELDLKGELRIAVNGIVFKVQR